MDQSNASGINDNFLACFQRGNTGIIWSSYLGSDFQESMDIPPYINSAFNLANTTIALDSQNRLHVLGTTNSSSTFSLDDGANIPYFQSTQNGLANDATITRVDVTDLNTIVGLADFIHTEFVFGMYPNPTSNYIVITNRSIAGKDLRYAIYDLGSEKLKEGHQKAADKKHVDVSFLQKGIYIINVSNGKKT